MKSSPGTVSSPTFPRAAVTAVPSLPPTGTEHFAEKKGAFANSSCVDFPYDGVEDLLTKISTAEGDSVTFHGVSDRDFDQVYLTREEMGREFRLSLYSAEDKFLIITIPKLAYESLHRHLDTCISDILTEMNLGREIISVGATEYTQRDHAGNRKAQGEGDSSRKPISQRPLEGDFPTLVIEAGYTQTWPSLRQKAKWWFGASSYGVKIMLLIKLSQQSTEITIEMWKADQIPVTRPGRVTTRALAAQSQPVFSPVCVQTIKITRAPGVSRGDQRRFSPSSYRVVTGLRLEFEDLFLRHPRQGEGDLILGTVELQECAALIWKTLPSI